VIGTAASFQRARVEAGERRIERVFEMSETIRTSIAYLTLPALGRAGRTE